MELVHQQAKIPNVRHSRKTSPVSDATTQISTTSTIITFAPNMRATVRCSPYRMVTVRIVILTILSTMESVLLGNSLQHHQLKLKDYDRICVISLYYNLLLSFFFISFVYYFILYNNFLLILLILLFLLNLNTFYYLEILTQTIKANKR